MSYSLTLKDFSILREVKQINFKISLVLLVAKLATILKLNENPCREKVKRNDRQRVTIMHFN